VALIVLVAATVAAEARPLPAAPMPRPRPARAPSFDAAAANAACEKCHAEIAREHRASLHAASATDPMYRRAHAIEPLAFCADCHAPEGDARASLGVACVTCHQPGDDVLAAPGSTRAPHALARDARFATDAACAACHEFRFPTAPPSSSWPGDFMQSTVWEHARSARAGESCASCHMPRVGDSRGGHRSHTFTASRDEALVRSAVDIAATRPARTRARIVVTPRAVGHAFPTGDLFRRLAITAEARDARGDVRARDVVILARHAVGVPRAPGALADDRVAIDGGASTVWLDLAGAREADTIAWRVVYQRVEHYTSTDERDALVEGEIVVASGTLGPR